MGIYDQPIGDSSGGGYNLGNPGLGKPKIWGKIKDWVYGKGRGGDEFSPYAQNGWYPIWKTADDEAMDTQAKIQQREADLSNPTSKYYTDYYKQLKGTLSAQSSLNSLLGLNRAMGLSMAGSATIANEQRAGLEGKIGDYASKGMQNLFQANTQGATSLLGMMMSDNEFQQQLAQRKKEYEDSQKFDWGSLLKTVGQVGGTIAAPSTGGASLAATAALSMYPTKMGGGQSYINNNQQFNQGGFNNWGYK